MFRLPQEKGEMKNKQYHTVGTVPNSNRKIVERVKSDTPNAHIHDCSLSRLGTDISIKSGGVKLVLWARTSPLNVRIVGSSPDRIKPKTIKLVFVASSVSTQH